MGTLGWFKIDWFGGYTHVKVEVDCLLALHLLDQEGKHVNAYSNFIRQIISILDREWQIELQHVYREGNKCADFLASYTLQLDVGKHLLLHPPDGLRRLLDEDEHGVGQDRLIVVT